MHDNVAWNVLVGRNGLSGISGFIGRRFLLSRRVDEIGVGFQVEASASPVGSLCVHGAVARQGGVSEGIERSPSTVHGSSL